MDLVDEQDVALFQIGEQRRQIAGLGDDGAGRGAEIDAEFARHDLRQRRLAQARRTGEQHMVQRLAAPARGLDEHSQVLPRLRLADELLQPLRPERRIGVFVFDDLFRGDQAVGQRANSLSPSRISVSAVASSPASFIAAATAAPAWA
mgnify:CR=1 FL=1